MVTTGIGGNDILDGNKKLIAALVWQLMRFHYLQIVGSKTEQDLIKWANSMVEKRKITGFKDKSFQDGLFLIDLCAAIEPRIIDWDIVQTGETDEEKENNAKYVISIVRKFGAVIFCVWEDITKVNFKMLLVLVCSLYDVHQQL